MKNNSAQKLVIPLDGGTRAVFLDGDGRTYGFVRAETLKFLLRKYVILQHTKTLAIKKVCRENRKS